MLDIKYIRENPEKVQKGAKDKGVEVDIDRVLQLDEERRKMIVDIEQKRAERNKISHKGAGPEVIEQGRQLKSEIKSLEEHLDAVENDYNAIMVQIPNPAFDDVPVGEDDEHNKVKEKRGKIPKFDFKVKDHMEIGEQFDIIDTKRATKVAGSRFYYLKGQAALLEFALINLALAKITKKGFIPVIPPVMIKSEMAKGTGYFEQVDANEAYYIQDDDMFLIGTSEQTLITMHAGETLEEADLPKLYLGFSTCFRREAGSYGKDTKGILRAHQFDKLEMVVLCKPEDSLKYHELLLEIETELMDALELPYQIIDICTGDLGLPAAKKYDIEVWMPSQDKYRETHSTSNCTDFQSRRLNIKYKDTKTNKAEFVHILNGTAFSMRPLIAILENNQQKDGSIKIPKVLHKYLPFKEIKAKK
ncbi:MAG: serine--tRNA ligase [Parcubacteria group bacterium]|nr:serine--tRNA ligase [Parcubacteria group bacterium]